MEQRHKGKYPYPVYDPEPVNYLALTPALQFEMMVEWTHEKHFFIKEMDCKKLYRNRKNFQPKKET